EELEHELGESKRVLTSWGLDVKNFVAPYGSNDAVSVRKIQAKYYNSGYTAGGGVVVKPIKNHLMTRVPLGSYTPVGQNTLDFYKSKVDEAIAKNGWVIFMSHVWHPDHDAT